MGGRVRGKRKGEGRGGEAGNLAILLMILNPFLQEREKR